MRAEGVRRESVAAREFEKLLEEDIEARSRGGENSEQPR